MNNSRCLKYLHKKKDIQVNTTYMSLKGMEKASINRYIPRHLLNPIHLASFPTALVIRPCS